MDREIWWTIVQGVKKSHTQLSTHTALKEQSFGVLPSNGPDPWKFHNLEGSVCSPWLPLPALKEKLTEAHITAEASGHVSQSTL